MLVVRSVQTLAEWQALQAPWQALVKADSKATLCNSWEWNNAWVRQFWQSQFKLQVLVVEDDNDLSQGAVAILPLYINTDTAEALFVGTGEPEACEVASEYLDLLLDESRYSLAQVAPLLCEAMLKLRCAMLRFLNCLASSRVLQLTAKLPRFEKTVAGRQYGIDLSQTLAQLMQQFSYKQRKNGQLLLNRFDKNAELGCELLLDAASHGQLWEQLRELHQADWTAREQPGAFASVDFLRFHEHLQRHGTALQPKYAVLRHEGEVLALHYYYQLGERLYYYQSGTVKDRFQQYSPGKMLHMLAFRQLAGSGLYYDFMKGALQGSYKAAMCPPGELCYHLAVYRGSMAGRWRWWRSCVKRWLKQWRKQTGGEGVEGVEGKPETQAD